MAQGRSRLTQNVSAGASGCRCFGLLLLCFALLVPSVLAGKNLQSERLSEPYKARLADAARVFAHWAATKRIDLGTAMETAEGATGALIGFIPAAHDSGP